MTDDVNLVYASLYSLEEGIENLSHFTRKYIIFQVIYEFWAPLVSMAIIGGIFLLAVMLIMVWIYILSPIKQLVSMTNLIMGRKENKGDDKKIHKDLDKLKYDVRKMEHTSYQKR